MTVSPLYADNPFLNQVATKSQLSSVINWMSLSKNDSTTHILNDDAQDLPVVDPDAAMAGALAGTGAGGITREELVWEKLSISAQLRARIILVKQTDLEDARNNSDGVNITKMVEARAAGRYANTIDGEIMTALRGANQKVEYTTDADIAANIEEMLGKMEDADITPTNWILPNRSKKVLRAAKDSQGRYLFVDATKGQPAQLHGFPVSFVNNRTFTTAEFGLLASKPWIHAGVRKVAETEVLKELYAESDAIGFKVRARVGSKVLAYNGQTVPAVIWANDTV